MSTAKVPTRVTVAQVQAAAAALGITWDDLNELHLEGRRGSAVHIRRDVAGRIEAAGGEIATTTRTFGIRDLDRAEKRAAARDRIRRARWTR